MTASMWDVQLFELNYDAREVAAVEAVLKSGWITMGPRTGEFETSFGDMLGQGECTAVSSGTAALHLALLALGIGPGDEVIVPALTFVADVNVVRMVGADPVLADCESLDVWNAGAEAIAARITPRTRAVICVHYAGFPCRMDELTALCRERGLFLIEDCAHAPGASFGGRAVGTYGDISAFSFFTNKNLSVGEGGMAVATDADLHTRLRYLRSHGMTALTLDRYEGRAHSYDVMQPGLNYRIDEMRAALGLVQLDKLPEANRRRTELAERYRERLGDVEDIELPFVGYDVGTSAHHIFPILVDGDVERTGVARELKRRRIEASVHYPQFSGFSAYGFLGMHATPIADDVSERELTLPLYPTMGMEKVDLVCDALLESLEELRARHG